MPELEKYDDLDYRQRNRRQIHHMDATTVVEVQSSSAGCCA